MSITVLLADPRADSRRDLEIMLSRDREVSVVGGANDRRDTIDLTRQLRPSIVLLDGALLSGDSLSIIDEIAEACPDSSTIVLLDGADMELMRRLMRAGARDCLMRPVSSEDLLSAVRHVHQTTAKQRDIAPLSPDSTHTRGEVIAIYSPQGGAGKSMLSANLAVALAKACGEGGKPPRVALVDLNLQFGDIDLMLNLSPQNTIAGLAQKGHGGIDAELLEQYLTLHPESGLKVLVAPSTPQYAESITVYTVEQ
ncbi:MAG: response regulator, partial [Oxalobacteraceae bacterium]